MKTINIIIDKVNYFGNSSDRNYNAKVLYHRNGKLFLAHIDIDFFNKQVYIPKQPKECKVLTGFYKAIQEHQFKTV
jgi:hypothetical protein